MTDKGTHFVEGGEAGSVKYINSMIARMNVGGVKKKAKRKIVRGSGDDTEGGKKKVAHVVCSQGSSAREEHLPCPATGQISASSPLTFPFFCSLYPVRRA